MDKSLNQYRKKKYKLYFFFFGDYVKVGMTINTKRRLKEIRGMCPLPFMDKSTFTFSKESDCRKAERYWHKLLKEYRVRGRKEWFTLPDSIDLKKLKNFKVDYVKEIIYFDNEIMYVSKELRDGE